MKKAIKKVIIPDRNYYSECYAFAVKFIKKNHLFSSEDIIDAYNKIGLNIPKEPRVWGAVMAELSKLSLIYHRGYSRYIKPCGHGKPINIWGSNICK